MAAMPAKLRADQTFRRCLAMAAGVSVLALAAIVLFLLSQALPIFSQVSLKDFLFSTEWYPTDDPPVFGIGALILGSLACAALTTVIAVPTGVLTACAIHAGMPDGMKRVVKPMIELMAALPSVVIGFIGMIILAPWLQNTFGLATGLNLTNASIMLAFMCVPTIASISEEVELRWAMGGIATAVMLGISRVIGETMVVLMVAGGAAIIPESIFDPVRPMTSSIAAEMAEAAVGDAHYHALYATGLVLFLITFVFNLCAWYAARRFGLEKNK